MITLKHPYIQVNTGNQLLYGGNQDMMHDNTMHMVGCGVVSAVDTLMYLHLHDYRCKSAFFEGVDTETVEFSVHEKLSERMRRSYLPLIPHFGINGLELIWGINAYFKKYNIPFKAHLGKNKTFIFAAIDEMLLRDIPVILSVGPNFPVYWGKEALPFYTRDNDDRYTHYCSAKAHYVTVTGADENWLQISSWGRKYYINKQEYLSYTKAHSIPLFNTIVYLSEETK